MIEEEESTESQTYVATGEMPVGNDTAIAIRSKDVRVSTAGAEAPAFTNDDAAATVVRGAFERAKEYVERNSWLMEWQANDVLYQSQNRDNWTGVRDGRPVRISRFLIAKNTNTMSNQVHRSIFGEQKPFVLMGEKDTDEKLLDAWTHLIWVLMKRADFEYNLGVGIEMQTLQGTSIYRPGWETRQRVVRGRRRKKQPAVVETPVGGSQTVNTQESDDFEPTEDTVTESYPIFEYRRLGYTLYDPKWCTPNRPDLSADDVVHVDFVDFQCLQQLRDLPCYKNIPSDAELIAYFITNPHGDAQPASQTAAQFTSQNSTVMHAEGPQRQIGNNPFTKPLMLVSEWDRDQVRACLVYDGHWLTVRNDKHELGDHALGYTANWWNIEDSGYGIGVGRLNSGDQRMEAGVLNEVLKMIGLWFNQPLLIRRGSDAPTQNVVAGLATFLQVDPPPDGDVRKAMGYIERPEIPQEAWRIYQLAQQGGEQLVGADQTFMQGNLGGPGSSAARTATGANRIGSKADENVSLPVRHLEIVITRFIEFLIEMVKTKMPIPEIRQILKKQKAEKIIADIDVDSFLQAKFEVNVLAGQKLMAKQAILQLIPFLLQIVQQPQMLDALHQTGRTVDFESIESLFLRMSELQGEDPIFRAMTPRERVQFRSNGQQGPLGARLAVENVKSQGRIAAINAKGNVDLTTRVAEAAIERGAGAAPLDRASALNERAVDEQELQNGPESMA